MAIVNSYSTLQTAIADWLTRDNLTTFIPNFIQNWEADFMRDPKNFGMWMEHSRTDAIVSSFVAVPADYLKLKYAYIATNPASRLDRMSINQLYGRYPRAGGGTFASSAPGIPQGIARETNGGTPVFVFGPSPDGDYDVRYMYWAKQDALSDADDDATDHYLITDTPDLCLFGALLQAEAFIKNDPRVDLWRTMYNQALVSYRNLQRDEETAGSPVQEFLA